MDEKLRIIRLTTGEEVLGEIEEQNEQTVRIKNPCVLGITMNPNGKAGLQMQPLLLFSEQKVVNFKTQHILYEVSVATELRNKYNEIYGSGIVVAKSPLIT
jgi:hypothetical protein